MPPFHFPVHAHCTHTRSIEAVGKSTLPCQITQIKSVVTSQTIQNFWQVVMLCHSPTLRLQPMRLWPMWWSVGPPFFRLMNCTHQVAVRGQGTTQSENSSCRISRLRSLHCRSLRATPWKLIPSNLASAAASLPVYKVRSLRFIFRIAKNFPPSGFSPMSPCKISSPTRPTASPLIFSPSLSTRTHTSSPSAWAGAAPAIPTGAAAGAKAPAGAPRRNN